MLLPDFSCDREAVAELTEERREVQKDLIKHMRKNRLPITTDFWRRFNKSIQDRVRSMLRPDVPIRRDKKVDERRLRRIFKSGEE